MYVCTFSIFDVLRYIAEHYVTDAPFIYLSIDTMNVAWYLPRACHATYYSSSST